VLGFISIVLVKFGYQPDGGRDVAGKLQVEHLFDERMEIRQ